MLIDSITRKSNNIMIRKLAEKIIDYNNAKKKKITLYILTVYAT